MYHVDVGIFNWQIREDVQIGLGCVLIYVAIFSAFNDYSAFND